MTKLQFRILYRQFLFRMIDLELLSADALGDMNKLFGQFASLLVFFSIILALSAANPGSPAMSAARRLALSLREEHFLVATTMLAVGLFAVLCWDSTFPDRRDVMVLAPMPVRAWTLFRAKVAAVGTAMGLTVVLLHSLSGLLVPGMLAALAGSPSVLRCYFAFWLTMLASGAFLFCCILALQGLAAQLLPRRLFLRVSSVLQMAAFCAFVCAYFLEPAFAGLAMIGRPETRSLVAWVPTYWFTALYHQLSGPPQPELAPLAQRAWVGLAIAIAGTGTAYALSYLRTIRQIVEQPDIASSSRWSSWLPRFGAPVSTAIVQFSIRTLLRSRLHRLILAFYLGLGLAFTILLVSDPRLRRPNVPVLAATIIMLTFWTIGTRVVFTLPMDLRANWIFRTAAVRGGPDSLAASRRALLALSIGPAWLIAAATCFWMWPWPQAAGHIAALGLFGLALADICLHGFQKIPFTCSYLPGRTQVHMVVWAVLALLWIAALAAHYELQALAAGKPFLLLLAGLSAAVVFARRWANASALSDAPVVLFEQEATPAVQGLGLMRDGVLPFEEAVADTPIRNLL
jgi:hypothetical protein